MRRIHPHTLTCTDMHTRIHAASGENIRAEKKTPISITNVMIIAIHQCVPTLMLSEFPYPDNEAELNGTVCLIIHKAARKKNICFCLLSSFVLRHRRAENGQRVGENEGDINGKVKTERVEEELRLTGGHSTVTRLRLIHSHPVPTRQRLETSEFNCFILGSPTWQNLPFNAIRPRVLCREVSFQGHTAAPIKGENQLWYRFDIFPSCFSHILELNFPFEK